MSFLSDIGHVYFNGGPDEECFNKHELILGQYIPPRLRLHEVYTKHESFEEWIDWYWGVWLEEEFAYTSTSITPEMRDLWNVGLTRSYYLENMSEE
jgi:hypothetical protein